MKPWHFTAQLQGSTVRVLQRNEKPFWNDKPYRDLDVEGKDERRLFVAREFLFHLGYQFPLPQSAGHVTDILSFRAWRNLEGVGYADTQQKSDRLIFWQNKMLAKSHAELWQWARKTAVLVMNKRHITDREGYAMSCLLLFYRRTPELDEFYGKKPIPTEVVDSLSSLKIAAGARLLGGQFIP